MKIFVIFLLLFSLIISGCKKDEPKNSNETNTTIQDVVELHVDPVIEVNEPVYAAAAFGLTGPFVCEFASDGSNKDMIRQIEQYIHNGRLYFISISLPMSTGNLRPGFEFNIDLERATPRIKAEYRGSLQNPITSEHLQGEFRLPDTLKETPLLLPMSFLRKKKQIILPTA